MRDTRHDVGLLREKTARDLPLIRQLDRLKPVRDALQYTVRVHYYWPRTGTGNAPQVLAKFLHFAAARAYAEYLQTRSPNREYIALIEIL